MEEKTHEVKNRIRSIPGYRNLHKFFPREPYHSTNHGFSLIELLVVIAVIGVLAGSLVVIINPIRQIQKAHDGRRASDLRQIQTGLELYRTDQGNYPAELRSPLTNADSSIIYMKNVPKDPKGGAYNYVPGASNNTYTIYACAENSNKPGGAIAVDTDTCISGWQFVVTSP